MPLSSRRRFLGRLAAFGSALALVATAIWFHSPRVRREPGLSVLLVTIDTLRADALGAYGRPHALTPWMDRLATEGVRWEDAHAHNVVTLPSHANILSGRHPTQHGVRDNAGFRFPSGIETLATLLQAQGYRTGAFVSAFPLDSRFGLGRGFDVYDDSFVDAEARPAFLLQERPGTATVALARRWIEATGDQPFFCWVHLFEPHYPYEPPAELDRRFQGEGYQGEVAAADAALGPLLEPIFAAGRHSRTLVVLTSDHGESLGDHGEVTHGIFAYEATLRVPLILHQPRLLGPKVVREPARHVDILPTTLDLLALPLPEGLPGHSLLPAIAGQRSRAETTTYFEALSGQLNRGWAPLHGVIRSGKKLIDLPIPELYDLAADAAETRNLAPVQPQPVEELHAALSAFRREDRGGRANPESAETRERLQALGYLASGAAAVKDRYTEDDDPKRLIGLDAMLQDVVGFYLAGDLDRALARSRELVRLRPEMPVSLLQLAQLERARGHLDAAVQALRTALAVNPGNEATISLLGASLIQAGRAQEAVATLEPYVRERTPDVDVLATMGLALARSGRTQEALATLARAQEVDPSSAMVPLHRGTVLLMAGERVKAGESFEAALALNPRLARARSSLGMLAAEAGDVETALEHWKTAVALDPGEYPKLVSLSELLWRQARSSEARVYLGLFVAGAPRERYGREAEAVRKWLATGTPPRARSSLGAPDGARRPD